MIPASAPALEPIVVDLDGTLTYTDTFWECICSLLRRRTFSLAYALTKLRQGRATFKQHIAGLADFDAGALPLNNDLIVWLRQERRAGRRLVLATASDRSIAQAVADHVDLFDEVLASDGDRNLKGPAKAVALVERFGVNGFDYVGDSRADLPVWAAARHAIVVGGEKLVKAAAQVTEVRDRFAPPERSRAVLLALRPHQWVKNLLVFLPLVAAHRFADDATLPAATLAFVIFCLAASSVYVLNDLIDLPSDRAHARKRQRPFASGRLPLAWGVLLSALLLVAAAALGLLFLPPLFNTVLAGYYLLTAAYSFGLKREPILDVILLAGLYTVRVIAGAAAVAIVPSFWLLAFSMFIFLSLALAKRYTELDELRQRGELIAPGRGWHIDDLPLIQTLGSSSGLACVLVLALYIDSAPATRLYAAPQVLWLFCPLLLYWITRLWFITQRGQMHDDPVVFALRDRVSLRTGAVGAGIVLLASVGLPL